MPKSNHEGRAAAKGERRRVELVEAGVAVLAEFGWRGLTHREVAARANANPGLVHYYFGGTRGLRHAVATEAIGRSVGAIFDEVLRAESEAELVDNIAVAVASARDDAAGSRLTAELVVAAFDDDQIADLVRAEFARGRRRLEHWLRDRRPTPCTQGIAAVIVAAVDGLVLHLVLDPDLPMREVEEAVRQLSASMLVEPARSDEEWGLG